MPDPLSLLRQYNLSRKEIIERDGQIILGEYSWPQNAKTNYLIMSAKKGNVKDYYTLECLLFFLKNKQLEHPEYVRQAAAANTSAVRRPDRKEMLKYLFGVIDTCASIDKRAPLEMPTKVKRSHDNEGAESAVKKPRIEETQVEKVQEHLETSSSMKKKHLKKHLSQLIIPSNPNTSTVGPRPHIQHLSTIWARLAIHLLYGLLTFRLPDCSSRYECVL